MFHFLTLCKNINNSIDVLRSQLIVVCNLNTLIACIDEESTVIRLILLHYHNAGRNRSSKEQIAWKLNNTINKVVIH